MLISAEAESVVELLKPAIRAASGANPILRGGIFFLQHAQNF
jgi:hypothetical protein